MTNRQLFLVKQEAEKIVAQLGRGAKVRAVTMVAKYVLLNAPYFYNGNSVSPVAKSLGAGVWELRNEKEQP